MKPAYLGLIFCMFALTGCQTVDPNSPEALKKAEYERIHLESTRANCTLLLQLNKQRAAQKKELAGDNRCASVVTNNALSGGIHPVSFVPDMSINGIPLPLGGLIKMAIQADRNERAEQAAASTLPAWATHTEGAKTAYRFLLFFKFTPEEIAILKSNPDFQDAARKNDRDLQFARANPQIVKQVQNSTY